MISSEIGQSECDDILSTHPKSLTGMVSIKYVAAFSSNRELETQNLAFPTTSLCSLQPPIKTNYLKTLKNYWNPNLPAKTTNPTPSSRGHSITNPYQPNNAPLMGKCGKIFKIAIDFAPTLSPSPPPNKWVPFSWHLSYLNPPVGCEMVSKIVPFFPPWRV